MRALPELIEEAYQLFASYTLGPTLSVCKACCVTDEDEQKLLATPLRQVSCELLHEGYYVSARNNSDQEHWEMKHFLPRMLELVSQFEFPSISAELTFNRIDLRHHSHWPPAERELLAEFALAYFEQCLQAYPLPAHTGLSELLILFGLAHVDWAPLLQAWAATTTPASFAHFSDLLVEELRVKSSGTMILTNPFSEPHIDKQLSIWLASPAVRNLWLIRLKNSIVQGQLPEDEAAEASRAYEMLMELP